MSVCSLGFFLGVLALAAVLFWLPAGSWRRGLLAACNAGFLALLIPNIASWVVLAAFLLSGWLVAVRVRSRAMSDRARTTVLTAYFVALLAVFLVLKQYSFLDWLIRPGAISARVSVVGLSYILFRQIHFIVDSAQEQITDHSLWTYLNYQLNLFTLYAGPIERHQDFLNSWASTRPILPDAHARRLAYARVLVGVVKVGFIGAVCLDYANRATVKQPHIDNVRDILKFATLFYLYPAYVYFNFAGYCDIVIGGASLAGIGLSENFNRPFLARNMLDYWNRWHMTLTRWIRDYIFTPLYKAGVERWPRHGRGLSYFSLFIALFLAGVWHGSSWNFVVFGALHGCGVAVTKMWEEAIIKRRGRPGLKRYLASRPIRWVATVVTVNFVCVTMLFFPPGLRDRATFLRRFVFERTTLPAGTTSEVAR
jgi:D-alanyl-lipoteichoic acid acyltransferase DltB (MBOAT superfamily)